MISRLACGGDPSTTCAVTAADHYSATSGRHSLLSHLIFAAGNRTRRWALQKVVPHHESNGLQ
jgi:hypothetical protein